MEINYVLYSSWKTSNWWSFFFIFCWKMVHIKFTFTLLYIDFLLLKVENWSVHNWVLCVWIKFLSVFSIASRMKRAWNKRIIYIYIKLRCFITSFITPLPYSWAICVKRTRMSTLFQKHSLWIINRKTNTNSSNNSGKTKLDWGSHKC